MRLGQVARKYDIPVQELIDFLSEETGERFHPNSKLFDGIESRIFEAFDLEPPEEETIEAVIDESVNETETEVESIDVPIEQASVPETTNISLTKVETPEDDIALAEGELAFHSEDEVERQPIQDEEPEKLEPQEDEIILSDQLIEMMESDEAPADLDKVKLIKAPKKELPGLKVLGKVDLPEPKPKSTDKDDRSTKNRKPQLSEEEKEKRRLKAKRKKEAYEAKREKQRKEQETQRLKNLKQKHYQQRVQKPQEVKRKAKVDPPPPNQTSSARKKTKPQPKTWSGKWWRWMNT